MANISYIRFLSAIEYFCKEHRQIRRFASDFPGQLPNFATKTEEYPILFVSPSDSIFNENTTTFNVDIYCFDIIQKDRSNINTILSDTNLILSDLNRWIIDGEIDIFDILNSPTATPLNNELLDYCAGWRMTLTIDCPTYGVCEIPFIQVPSITTEINNVVYNDILTCENLADCDTFTDAIGNLQLQIDNIELTPGPTGANGANGATGATGPQGDSFFTTISLDAYTGTRLTPKTPYNGLTVMTSSNTNVGLNIINMNTGNGAISSISVSATSSASNGASLTGFSSGYYVPYLRNNFALLSFGDLFINTYNNKSIDFRTGNAFGTETSKFRIDTNGQINIGVTPSFGSSNFILGRNSTGNIISLTASNFIGVTGATGPRGATGATGPANPIVSGYFTPDANTLTLVDSLGGEVIIYDEINIIEKNLPEILSLIDNRELVRGVTYKINGVDVNLYSEGTGDKGTTIYLLALEDNKLDTFGTGIFYTPKYDLFSIWNSGVTYLEGDKVIWGGYVWVNKNGNTGSSISNYLLNDEWDLRGFNKDEYDVVWDKIKYDIVKDKITYRNEKNINEVSFNFEELKKIQLETGDYCPIRAFQWGRGFSYNEDKGRLEGIGNQRIYNSLNRNINFDGVTQNNILLNNQSFIYDINVLDNTKMTDIQLDNGSKIKNVTLSNQCDLQYIKLDNQSYINDITLEKGSYIINLDMNNMSFIEKLTLISAQLDRYTLNNQSYISNCDITATSNYNMLYDNNASQIGTNNFDGSEYYYQINTTIKNTQITEVVKNHDGWFFLGDLPDSVNTTDIIGRDSGNRLVDTSLTGYVPYVGATGDVDLGEWGITAKYYDRPYDSIGGFYIKEAGPQYLSFRFDSYGDAEGVPDCSWNANGEEGITLMANLNDLSQFTQMGCNSQWGYVYVRGTATESNTSFYPDRTTFTQQTELPKVLFNSTTETSEEKSLTWNDADGTLDLGLKGGNVTLQIGQESVIRVVNKTATNITLLESNYQVVRVTGAQGNRLKVDLALATDDFNSAETIGLVTETILDNQEGFVTTSGLVRNINTTGSIQGETWLDGDILYLSPNSPGNITKIKPVAPQHLVVIGYVVKAHITQGQIFVKINNGYELDELHNVAISGTPSNNQVLSYNSSINVWQNRTIRELTDLQIRKGGYLLFEDFHTSTTSGQGNFITTVVNGGTTTTFSQVGNPGIRRISSSATGNSGGNILFFNSAVPVTSVLTPGMQFDVILRLPSSPTASTVIRTGLIHGTNNNADAQNGNYFEITGNSLVGKTANSTTRSSTATFILDANTFYHLRTIYNSTTLNTFQIYTMNGTLVWSATLTTNINNGSVSIQPALIALDATGGTRTLVEVDYIGFTQTPYSGRGATT